MDSLDTNKIFSENENKSDNIKNVGDKVVRFSFYITYAFLMRTLSKQQVIVFTQSFKCIFSLDNLTFFLYKDVKLLTPMFFLY